MWSLKKKKKKKANSFPNNLQSDSVFLFFLSKKEISVINGLTRIEPKKIKNRICLVIVSRFRWIQVTVWCFLTVYNHPSKKNFFSLTFWKGNMGSTLDIIKKHLHRVWGNPCHQNRWYFFRQVISPWCDINKNYRNLKSGFAIKCVMAPSVGRKKGTHQFSNLFVYKTVDLCQLWQMLYFHESCAIIPRCYNFHESALMLELHLSWGYLPVVEQGLLDLFR